MSCPMHDMPLLRDLVVIVAVAIPVVLLAQRFRVPTVVGFLLTGLAIGPHALGLVREAETVSDIAEIGTVLLLFTVGLELSLSRILQLGREVLIGGTLQALATVGIVAAACGFWDVPLGQALFAGCLVALSSTAIVLKIYADRQELDTPHGRAVVAILLFQDLCVVPMMLLLPLMAGTAPSFAGAMKDLALSLGVVAALVVGGRLFVPWLLARVVGLRSREIFTLCIVTFGLGAAWLTAQFGLSLALGAFLAGLVIAESDFGLQALSDVLPFRDVFSGIFFTSVGMLLDIGLFAERPLALLGATGAVLVVKVAVVVAVVLLLRYTLRAAVTSAFALAQVGEFSFVLAGAGLALGLEAPGGYQNFLAAAVITMLLTPVLTLAAGPLAERLIRWTPARDHGMQTAEMSAVQELKDHTIIVGYGLNGRNLAQVLRASQIPYVVLEQNGHLVRRAREQGEHIYFGDGTRGEVLQHVKAEQAKVIVFVVASPEGERRGVASARQLAPKAHIVVRTRYVSSIDKLQELGANEVVPEEFETSLEIFSRVLRRYGVPASTIRAEVQAARRDHYEMFTGRERPAGHATGMSLPVGIHIAVETVELEDGAEALGSHPASLRLRERTGVTVVAVLRGGKGIYDPDPEFRFRTGDTVVMVGTPDALRTALPLFRR